MKFTIGFKGLPFEFDHEQIVYVESEYNVAVNNFILDHYKDICDYFASQGFEFIYLPLLHGRFDRDVIQYYDPQDGRIIARDVDSSLLLNFMARPQNRHLLMPSLIYWKKGVATEPGEDIALRGISVDDERHYDFCFAAILSAIIRDRAGFDDDRDIRLLIEPRKEVCAEVFCEGEEGGTSYSLNRDAVVCDYVDPVPALEEQFDVETKTLMAEIEERVNRLKQKGISLYVLENMLRPHVEVSRMVITPDFRILLPDYNNMEIEMTPLVKAVYILFLCHPEGIAFKDLVDYREELEDIYADVRGRVLTSEMRQSVIMATSPFNNSINEKCARIREAFVAKFDERLAEPYIVRGRRGEPKCISISRDLVEWGKGDMQNVRE